MSTVTTWDVKDGPYAANALCKDSYVESLAISGDYFVSAQVEWLKHVIKVWDLHSEKFVAKFTGHGGAITGLAVYGSFVISGSRDKTVKIWEITSKKCLLTLTHHHHELSGVSYFRGTVVSWDIDSTLILSDFLTGKNIRSSNSIIPKGGARNIGAYEGRLLTHKDNKVEIWDLDSLTLLHTIACDEETGHRRILINEQFFAVPRNLGGYKIWSWDGYNYCGNLGTACYSGAIFDHFFLEGNGGCQLTIWDISDHTCSRNLVGADIDTCIISRIAMHGSVIVADVNNGLTVFKLGAIPKGPGAILRFIDKTAETLDPYVSPVKKVLDKVFGEGDSEWHPDYSSGSLG